MGFLEYRYVISRAPARRQITSRIYQLSTGREIAENLSLGGLHVASFINILRPFSDGFSGVRHFRSASKKRFGRDSVRPKLLVDV
jgi:hypothetical protein